jgi:hypothetical protein
MFLSCSCAFFAQPMSTIDQASWTASHVAAFEFFGGVPGLVWRQPQNRILSRSSMANCLRHGTAFNSVTFGGVPPGTAVTTGVVVESIRGDLDCFAVDRGVELEIDRRLSIQVIVWWRSHSHVPAIWL